MKPAIFTYLDYRQYLLDLITFFNRESPSFSFSFVAKCVGSQSQDFLRRIIDRKINLDKDKINALSKYFKLNKDEKAYFHSIVAFDHAKNNKEKDRSLQRVLEQRQYPAIKSLEEQQYDYFSHWYMPVVRELATSPSCDGDPEWIALRIIPELSVDEVKNALDLLQSLKLITRDKKKNGWKLTNQVISSTPQVPTKAAIEYHTDAINLGRESITRFDSNERDIRSVTLKLSAAGFKQMKNRLEAFWREIMAQADSQRSPDRVYTVNMQLFPMSQNEKDIQP